MDVLPAKNRLLAACRGSVHDSHPLLQWASELSEIHLQLLAIGDRTRGEIDLRRAELVHDIDVWITWQLPPSSGGARVHTETMGAVINRLAQFTAAAYAALANPIDGEVLGAWERLGELAIGYEDLADEVRVGRRRLPCAR